jgi:hypothetical protein
VSSVVTNNIDNFPIGILLELIEVDLERGEMIDKQAKSPRILIQIESRWKKYRVLGQRDTEEGTGHGHGQAGDSVTVTVCAPDRAAAP